LVPIVLLIYIVKQNESIRQRYQRWYTVSVQITIILNRKPTVPKKEGEEGDEDLSSRIGRSDRNLVKKHLRFEEFHDSRVIASHPSGRNFANHEYSIYNEDPYLDDNEDDKGKK
jgi:hypothetical protein